MRNKKELLQFDKSHLQKPTINFIFNAFPLRSGKQGYLFIAYTQICTGGTSQLQ